MSDYPKFPLEPIYTSYDRINFEKKTILNLLDLNFGRVHRIYLKLKYSEKYLQHRLSMGEIHPSERKNLTPRKIELLGKKRKAYWGLGLELLKFYFEYGKAETQKAILEDKFRFKLKDQIIITDCLDGEETEIEQEQEFSIADLVTQITNKSKL